MRNPLDLIGRRTLYSDFERFAESQPDHEWLAYEGEDGKVQRWSYSRFLDSVHRAANLLCDLGIRPGDVFNIHLSNHPAYVQLILAASHLGAIAIPSNPASTEEELAYLLDHSESRVIFTEVSCLPIVEKVAADLSIETIQVCRVGGEDPDNYPVYEEELESLSAARPSGEGSSERVVELLYTSGTTSRPKGVMLTNACLVYSAEVFRSSTGLERQDRHLISLPMFHAGAQCHALWPSLVAGAGVVLLPRFSATRFFEQAIEYECTMSALFGAPLRMLLNQPEKASDRAHRIRNITFAQSLTRAQYETWDRRFGAALQQIWGMTETCSLPVMSPLSGDRNLQAMGRPAIGYELKVVDELEEEVPVGEPGELIVKGIPGRTLMLGYLKNPEATADTLRTHSDGTWLHSGDTVHADEDGFLYFLDRGKDLIKKAGENVSSIEVESVVIEHEGVLDVCVVGISDEIRDERIVAVVVKKDGMETTEESIRNHCAKRLSLFKVPDRIAFLDSLPRTSVGKIQKQIVREQLKKGEV